MYSIIWPPWLKSEVMLAFCLLTVQALEQRVTSFGDQDGTVAGQVLWQCDSEKGETND